MIVLAVVTLALLAALALQERSFRSERREWSAERQLLITRIQHPEFIVSTPDAPVIPDSEILNAEPDEINLVGEIVNNGNGDA